MDHLPASMQGHGLLALGAAVALVGVALGMVLLAVGLLAPRYPSVRVVLHPLNLALLVLQLMDGATTWVGVVNPFGFRIPPYEEQVLLSRLLIETFGGGAYFVFKAILGLVVIAALNMAYQAARSAWERNATHIVHIGIVGIGIIPVVNNVSNFLAVA